MDRESLQPALFRGGGGKPRSYAQRAQGRANAHPPRPQAEPAYSDFKIIPDSELVYGPASATLDVEAFVAEQEGYLISYSEEVDKQRLSGAQIVRRVSYEYSVNPRLLLALLEYQSGWVTRKNIDPSLIEFPMGRFEVERKGLYKQLAWTADQLNRAYYLYEINALPYVILADNRVVMLSQVINPGTAAVQYFAGLLHHHSGYMQAISEGGVYATYVSFFGIPFDLSVENLLPADLAQPDLLLPFESGVIWSYTSGPHGGWGSGSAWAALDFSPSGDASGCFRSDAWVTAAADGLVKSQRRRGVTRPGRRRSGANRLDAALRAHRNARPGCCGHLHQGG